VLLAAELGGAAELVQLAVGLADADGLASAELAAGLDEDAPAADEAGEATFTGCCGGRADSGGRTWVTSLITGAIRSAIAEAPLR